MAVPDSEIMDEPSSYMFLYDYQNEGQNYDIKKQMDHLKM
jgi:hypothetical protein